MNNNILKRALEELSKETPRLDYLRGMLETLIEMQPKVVEINTLFPAKESPALKDGHIVVPPKDEGTLLDMKAKASVEKLRVESERMNQ